MKNPYKTGAQEILTICWRTGQVWSLWAKLLKIGVFPAIYTLRAIFLTIVGILAICAILLILVGITAILPVAGILDFAAKFSHGGAFLVCVVLFVVLWLVRSGFLL